MISYYFISYKKFFQAGPAKSSYPLHYITHGYANVFVMQLKDADKCNEILDDGH